MKLNVEFISAFTEKAFQGNPAAVIVTESWLPETLMQAIATENNLSETAFVVKNTQGIYDIRWFSPITEIDFCGHATLASAFVLFTKKPELGEQTLSFHANAVGVIHVNQRPNGFIEMDFPARKPKKVNMTIEPLLKGLSIQPSAVYQNQQAYFALYEHENDVINVQANNAYITQLAPYDVIVTAPSNTTEYDFVSRYFWPANGGDEDPVTGSAHAGLTPFWAEKLNTTELRAFQASKRGGYLKCQLLGDRVIVAGQAVRYLSGEINVPDGK